MKVLVLGAGVIGVTSAWFLARQGCDVTVVEREAAAAQMTSFANGGQLSYSYTEPTAQPHLLPQLPELLMSYYAPLAIRPTLSPAFWRWGWHFLGQCRRERARENMEKILRLALYSRAQLLDLLAEEEGFAFDYYAGGKLYLYFDVQDMSRATEWAAVKNRYGCDIKQWDTATCLLHQPALVTVEKQLLGGLYAPLDASGDACAFTQQLAEKAVKTGRVRFVYGATVERLLVEKQRVVGVKTTQGDLCADAYVLALATATPEIAAGAGVYLPIYPMKGYSLTLPIRDERLKITTTDSKRRLVYSRLGDYLRIAGMAEIGYWDLDIREKKIAVMLRIARETFPQLADYTNYQAWAGLRPLSPDSAPFIGKTTVENLYVNSGHGMLGWTLACGSAALLATTIVGGEVPEDLKGFEPQRFS